MTPYVLGALEPDEVEEVELHLLWCDACRALVDEERQVADLLPYLAEPLPVPARARRQLLARVERLSDAAPEPAPPRRQLPVRLTRLGWVVAATAAVLALVFGINSLEMQAQVAKKETELTVLKDRQRTVAEFFAAPRGIVTPLQSTGAAPGAEGGVVLDPTRNAALLIVDGMPKPPAGYAYVVWMVRGDQHINVGVLGVDDQGRGSLYMAPSEALASFSGILVTEETGPLAQNPKGVRMLAARVQD